MSHPIVDRRAQRFGMLVVQELAPKPWKTRAAEWVCICDCGDQTRVVGTNLGRGTQSCGCRRGNYEGHLIHGHTHLGGWRSRTYQSWQAMKARCLSPRHRNYRHYGGRGITICQEWIDSFEAFLGDMGERPEGKTIDRIDNDRNYEPTNCRWATPSEQRHNQRERQVAM